MKKLFLASIAVIGLAGTAHAGVNPFVGELMIFAGNFCPTGYLPTDGRLLPIANNTPIFSVVGTTYGGDGTTNFALPNTKPIVTKTRAVLTECIALQGVFPPRN